MKLLYITYIDFGEMGSGSSVRPQRMAKAFEELGVEVKLISGLQNRKKERKETIKKTLEWLQHNQVDACYIEPPSCPIYLKEDRKLIETVHKMGIPSAVFYRDAHWLYADWWGVSGIKASVLKWMHKKDLKVFVDCCDMVYFPSKTMGDLFAHLPLKGAGVLPPACLEVAQAHKQVQKRLIYVGGVSKAYGTDLLLDAFRLLEEKNSDVQLTFCCREGEGADFLKQWENLSNVTFIHKSGDELYEYYKQCDGGILPLRRDRYMDFALPVKLFEYWGNALPVVATDCPEVKGMTQKYGCGVICEATSKSIANAIEEFYEENRVQDLFQKVTVAAGENRWVDRANQIILDLLGKGANQ